MQTEWMQLQVALKERHLSFDTPQSLLEWVDVQQSQLDVKQLFPSLIALQQLIVVLLHAIIEDTNSAAQSIIREASTVDTDTERLASYLKYFELKTSQLPVMQRDQVGACLEDDLHQMVNGLSDGLEMLRGLSGYVSKVSGRADEVHTGIQKMIAVLSFKAIMDAAIAEDKTKTFAQIAGEVRLLARQSADQSDDVLRFIDEMQLTLETRLMNLDSVIDKTKTQVEITREEIQSLLMSHVDLRDVIANTINVFDEGHNDIWGKIRMMYAQVQFQDIVRQKAERGIALIESGLSVLQQCLSGQVTSLTQMSLTLAIARYNETEQLHASFSHSGADASHDGGAMKIDLF